MAAVERMAGADCARILVAIFLVAAAPRGGAADSPGKALPAAIEVAHRRLWTQMSPEQTKALAALYPDFRLLTLCSGQFSGSERDELVLVVWKPIASTAWWKREVHRVGLIREGSAWATHVIDDELEQDKSLSHAMPMSWRYSLDERGFAGDVRCGVQLGADPDIGTQGEKPLFDREREGLQRHAPVCFATSDVYNNWDCVVYSPKDHRFRLWYQQVHAD